MTTTKAEFIRGFEAYPNDLWAPDVIGPTVTAMIHDIERKAEAAGLVPDWSTVRIVAREDNTFDSVLVTAEVDVLR